MTFFEFPDRTIKGSFTTPNHSRIGVSVNEIVTIYAKDEAGNLLGTTRVQSPKFTTDGSYFYGESATGKANIAEFEISIESSFEMATMTLDTAGVHHKPDFRFMLSDLDIPSARESGYIEFLVARLYGSTGPINLSISSTPLGLFAASPAPAPVLGADGTKVRVLLVGGSTSIKIDNVVTISGTRASATAGTSMRSVNYIYSPPLQPSPQS